MSKGVEIGSPMSGDIAFDDPEINGARASAASAGDQLFTVEEQEAVSASGSRALNKKKLWQRNWCRLLVVLLILGGVAGLVVGLLLNKNNDNDGEASASAGASDADNDNDGESGPSETEVSTKGDAQDDPTTASSDSQSTDGPTLSPATAIATPPTAAEIKTPSYDDETRLPIVLDGRTPAPSPVRLYGMGGSNRTPAPSPVRLLGMGGGDKDTPFPTSWGQQFSYTGTGSTTFGYDGGVGGLPPGGSNYEDDGSCGTPDDLTPVIDDRGTCSYELTETVSVKAPVPIGNNTVEKKLSGGTSAYDGDNAVIVSYSSDGLAGGVFVLSKVDTPWQDAKAIFEQSAILQTDDEDQLGWGVAIKGDTFVVGAPGYMGMDVPLIQGWMWAGRGRAIVWSKDEGTGEWEKEGILDPEEADMGSDFGNTVDIAGCGCLVAVGAWHDRSSRGSVYVFAKDDDGKWNEVQKIAPMDTRRSQSDHLHGNFGYTVAMNDDYLAVKAPYDSYTGSYDYFDADRGVVYVYKRGEDGLYEQVDRLCTPEGVQVRHHLKDVVFLDDFLLVGAPGKNKVYVFSKNSDGTEGYEKTAELTPTDGVEEGVSNFGIRLDGKGTNVMVGDLGGETSYMFAYEDGVWKEKAKFDGTVNTSLSGKSLVEHEPKSFEVDGEEYRGEVNFYDLVC